MGPVTTPNENGTGIHRYPGISINEVDCLLEVYESLDQDGNGVEIEEVVQFLRKSNTGWLNDREIERMENWFKASGLSGTISSLEFFQLYGRAPGYIERAFGCGGYIKDAADEEVEAER